jgi:acetyltransferase-like isoleucine patch superfamily enzyme
VSLLAATRARIALRACDVLGDGVRVTGSASIDNRGRMDIGAGAIICGSPVAAQLSTGPAGTLLVGANTTIGYGSSIVAEGLITIGEGTRIGPFAMICDLESDGSSGWRRSARPIVIGRGVRIGSKVTVLPGTCIADGAEVAAGSIVSGAEGTAYADDAAHATDGDASDVPRRVRRLVETVFDRRAAAPSSLALEQISGWSAGGALRLLLAVEAEFETRIPDEEWLALRSLGDLVSAVERRAPPPTVHGMPAVQPGGAP